MLCDVVSDRALRSKGISIVCRGFVSRSVVSWSIFLFPFASRLSCCSKLKLFVPVHHKQRMSDSGVLIKIQGHMARTRAGYAAITGMHDVMSLGWM